MSNKDFLQDFFPRKKGRQKKSLLKNTPEELSLFTFMLGRYFSGNIMVREASNVIAYNEEEATLRIENNYSDDDNINKFLLSKTTPIKEILNNIDKDNHYPVKKIELIVGDSRVSTKKTKKEKASAFVGNIKYAGSKFKHLFNDTDQKAINRITKKIEKYYKLNV